MQLNMFLNLCFHKFQAIHLPATVKAIASFMSFPVVLSVAAERCKDSARAFVVMLNLFLLLLSPVLELLTT